LVPKKNIFVILYLMSSLVVVAGRYFGFLAAQFQGAPKDCMIRRSATVRECFLTPHHIVIISTDPSHCQEACT
jgi:hypothetical protein